MTRSGLSSPELHQNCIVYEIGKPSCMLLTDVSQNQRAKSERQTANGEWHTAHGTRRTVNRDRQMTNGKRKQRKWQKKQVKTCENGDNGKRPANGERQTTFQQVSLSLSLSVSVSLQEHRRYLSSEQSATTHNFAQKADQRKCVGPSLWRDKKETDSVSFCQSLSIPTGLNLWTEHHRTNIFHS